jgi:probable addiction module antidote protein
MCGRGICTLVGFSRNALATVARSHGMSDVARRSGVTRPGIYKALGQDGNPSFETIRSILGAMG